MPDPFDPQFAIDAANNISSVARTVKGDPYCIGWFVDNEMSWGGGARPQTHFGLAYGAMSLDQKTSPAKAAFLAALRNQYGSIDALNRAWATNYAAWTVLEAPTILPSNPTPAQTSDMSSFLTDFATQYFTVVRNTIREYDPGHLYLGCRFAAYTPEAVAAATGICDVTSFNIYATSIDSKWDFLKPLDRPCIVGEFQFGALDSGMFNASLVPTISQQGRAIAFKTYVESVLAQPEFVGCHWFQYTDESAVGRWFDGENFNIGFTNVADNPYPDMVAASRTVAKEMYLRRFGASTASSR
jgi:hypothetical protein